MLKVLVGREPMALLEGRTFRYAAERFFIICGLHSLLKKLSLR